MLSHQAVPGEGDDYRGHSATAIVRASPGAGMRIEAESAARILSRPGEENAANQMLLAAAALICGFAPGMHLYDRARSVTTIAEVTSISSEQCARGDGYFVVSPCLKARVVAGPFAHTSLDWMGWMYKGEPPARPLSPGDRIPITMRYQGDSRQSAVGESLLPRPDILAARGILSTLSAMFALMVPLLVAGFFKIGMRRRLRDDENFDRLNH